MSTQQTTDAELAKVIAKAMKSWRWSHAVAAGTEEAEAEHVTAALGPIAAQARAEGRREALEEVCEFASWTNADVHDWVLERLAALDTGAATDGEENGDE